MFSPLAWGADHRDGPGVDVDATVDITDLYTWMSADGSKVYLVLDVQGANTGATMTTKFSNAALYAFHITSGAGVGTTAMPQLITCQFDGATTQGFQCWGPSGEYVKDLVGTTAGKTSASGKMKVAALVRDDPFPFNIRGFLGLANFVKGAAGSLTKDAAGCPTIDSATSKVATDMLKSDGTGVAGTGVDDFTKGGKAPVACSTSTCDATAVTNGNVLSIVIAIDKTLLTTNGNVLGVWASTNKIK
jgi:hypothetical protein